MGKDSWLVPGRARKCQGLIDILQKVCLCSEIYSRRQGTYSSPQRVERESLERRQKVSRAIFNRFVMASLSSLAWEIFTCRGRRWRYYSLSRSLVHRREFALPRIFG